MIVYCYIQGCKSTTYKTKKEENKNKLQFFGFPTNPVLRKKWIEALLASGQSKQHVAQIKKYSRICSLHFKIDCIEKKGLSYAQLKPNSVPTIFSNAPTARVANTENINITIFPNASTARMVENIEPINTPLAEMENDPHEETNNKTLSAKRLYYTGDIKIEKVKNMPPRTVTKSMTILKRTCEEKDKVINRLKVQLFREKRKIEKLETLLHELKKKKKA